MKAQIATPPRRELEASLVVAALLLVAILL